MTDHSKSAVWDERYAVNEYIFGTEPSSILTRHTQFTKAGETVLVIADGEGRNGVYLARQGLQVTSFDVSPIGIAKAKRLATLRQAALTILESDIKSWDWQPASFDAVVGIFFQFLDPVARSEVFAGITRTLKPNGRIFLRGYTPRQHHYKTGGPSEVENLYTPDLLLAAFQGFEVLHLEEQEVELNEGPRHSGMSAFVDFIARKL